MTRLVLAGVLILAVTACSFEGRSVQVSGPRSEAGLATWGAHLYVVGGTDASGNPRREVWRTTIGSLGALGPWVREADLAWPTASASVVTFGSFLYVLGGRSPDGPHREVWSTLINADGSLGFTNSVWVKNPRPLPSALSGAASFMVDGRLFLAGGETGDGPVDSVVSARIWLDGQVGSWYTGAPLPAPAVGLWAVDEGPGVVLRGPGGSGGYRSTRDTYGLPVWTESPPSSDKGPWVALAGRHFEVAAVNGVQPPTVISSSPDVVQAEAPRISPSAGVVPAQTQIKAQGLPRDRIVYTVTTDGSEPPTPADSATPPLLPKITKSAAYAFRTYRDGAAPSPTVVVRYQTQASSLFVLIQKTLTPPLALTEFSLNETLSDQSLHPVTSVRYQVNVSTSSPTGVSVIDADGGNYTARVRVSLVEADQRTPVRLSSGAEFFGLTQGASATLAPGPYYLVVESRDGNSGGTFALKLTQGGAN